MSRSNCPHNFQFCERIDDFGAQVTCLSCDLPSRIGPEDLERKWIAFESTEAPKWDRKERDIILVARRMLS